MADRAVGDPLTIPTRFTPSDARPVLDVLGIDDVLEHVDRLGTPTWQIEGLFPGDAYGVLGAEDKALKTWNGVDLLVSVACGRPWLGRFPCPQGPVTAFLGEGGPRNLLRRAEAVCTSKDLSVVDLIGQMRVCFTAPRLRDKGHLAAMADEFDQRPPKLVLIDPLYLSAVGAKGSDLYAMGELLGDVQRLTQEVGAALVVITHWNKGGTGSGPERFTGVGPGAWGSVLASAAVERRGQDPDGSNVVQLRWEFRGSEIPDTVFRARLPSSERGSPEPHGPTALRRRGHERERGGLGLGDPHRGRARAGRHRRAHCPRDRGRSGARRAGKAADEPNHPARREGPPGGGTD